MICWRNSIILEKYHVHGHKRTWSVIVKKSFSNEIIWIDIAILYKMCFDFLIVNYYFTMKYYSYAQIWGLFFFSISDRALNLSDKPQQTKLRGKLFRTPCTVFSGVSKRLTTFWVDLVTRKLVWQLQSISLPSVNWEVYSDFCKQKDDVQ